MRKIWFFLIALLLVAEASGQTKAPRIGLVLPAGGKAGDAVDVTLTGSDLDDAEDLYFSFPGAKTEILKTERINDPNQKKGGAGGGRGMNAPGGQFALKVKVHLPATAPLGMHDVRVVTKDGVSNPRTFVVGDQPEELEKNPNDDVPQAQKIPLGSSVHGVISTPTDVDYYQFTGKAGQRVVASCLTTSIDSRLPVALQMYTLDGKFLGFNRNYANNDAVLDATLPADGDYLLRVFGFSHTIGGPDYAYRLTVGTAPWIDAVIPAAAVPGKGAKVTVLGRNLPGGKLDPDEKLDGRPLEKMVTTIKARPQEHELAYSGTVLPMMSSLSGIDLRVKNGAGSSNPYLLTFARGTTSVEKEPNDRREQASGVLTPGAATGRIERRGDIDWYRFTGKKGNVLAIDIFGDRLGSPVDLRFVVQDAKGAPITSQDENQEILSNQFFARSDDPPAYRFTVPQDGDYFVGVSASDNTFSPRHTYVLRIGPEEADFQVIAMPVSAISPDSAVVGAEGNYAFTLLIWRMGGFTGDITVEGDKLPPGATMKPQVISGNQKVAAAVMSVATGAPSFTGRFTLKAHAVAGGKKIARNVRGGSISYAVPAQQQNTPVIARLDRELVMAIRGKAPYTLVAAKDQVTFPQGERVSVGIKLVPIDKEFKQTVQLAIVNPPTGLGLQPVTLTADKDTTVTFDSKTPVPPGVYTLVLRGQTQPVTNKPPTKPAGGPNIVEHAPPIQLTVVPKQMLKIKNPDPVKVQRGQSADAQIQWSRVLPFEGPIEVELVPANVKGITAAAAQSTGADDQVALKLQTSDEAAVGTATVTVRLTARFHQQPVVHETKLSVNITQ